MQAPSGIGPKTREHDDGGSTSPSQNPGSFAIIRSTEMQWPAEGALNVAQGGRVLVSNASHATPSLLASRSLFARYSRLLTRGIP